MGNKKILLLFFFFFFFFFLTAEKNITSCFLLQEPIFVPDPVISLAVEAKNKVKTNRVKVFIIVNCMLQYTLMK